MRHLFITALLVSFSISFAFAQTTIKSCNRNVTFETPPQRAISNDVNLTEMMLVLGLADHMVGYTGISGWKTLDAKMREGVKNSLSSLPNTLQKKYWLVPMQTFFSLAGTMG